MTNNQLTDGVIDVWFNAAKAAIHHPATPRNENSHAFAAYTLAQEVRKLRAELQEHRTAAALHFQRGYDEGHSRGLTCGRLYKADDQMRQYRAACMAAYRIEINGGEID